MVCDGYIKNRMCDRLPWKRHKLFFTLVSGVSEMGSNKCFELK